MKNIYNYFCIVIIALLCVACHKKPNEASFIQHINSILKADKENILYSDEKINSFFDYIADNPQSLDYQLENWSDAINEIIITTAYDDKIRAYSFEKYGFQGNPSWGMQTRILVQYRYNGSVKCQEITGIDGCIRRMAALGNDLYWVEIYNSWIAQGMHNYLMESVYKLTEDGLVPVANTFETEQGLASSIEIYWNECDFDDYSDVIYSPYLKELYIPKSCTRDSEVYLIESFNAYRWKNDRFELAIVAPIEVKNKDYYIRIEQQKDGSCTYQCWNGGVKRGTPNLTLHNGKMECWGYDGTLMDYDKWASDDGSTPIGYIYTFYNNGYRYKYTSGYNRGETIETLYVYDPDGNTIYAKSFEQVIL